MKEKMLIFIPYQDADNFLSDGIMTREFAMLYMLWEAGYKEIINIKKPRTLFDKKRYTVKDEYYPKGTKECIVREILGNSETIQYAPIISISQILHRRIWWKNGYQKIIKMLQVDENKEYLVYSNNPFAVSLLDYLSNQGCKIFFDIMDNFAIHPSFNKRERAAALNGYQKTFKFANYLSANSKQTCEFMKNYTEKKINLVKNGVFLKNEALNMINLKEIQLIKKKKTNYIKCVGYIGKLGLRLDAELIDAISEKCSNILFVFVGGCLKGQINESLLDLFKKRNNILHIDAIPSAYVYPILNEFDILMIPHSVGKNENGGDPLKLYQYLTRNKPIITTPIIGVDEFKNQILISSNFDEWVDYIIKDNKMKYEQNLKGISWSERIRPVFNEMNRDYVKEINL